MEMSLITTGNNDIFYKSLILGSHGYMMNKFLKTLGHLRVYVNFLEGTKIMFSITSQNP